MVVTLAKAGVAGAALAAVCAASSRWLLADWATQGLWSKSLALFGTIIAAGGAFAVCAALLKVQELDAVFKAVKRRLRLA